MQILNFVLLDYLEDVPLEVILRVVIHQRNKDIKEFVKLIEKIILKILKRFGVNGILDHEHHGIFIKKDDGNLYKI